MASFGADVKDGNVPSHGLDFKTGLVKISFTGLWISVRKIQLIDGNEDWYFFLVDYFDDLESLLFDSFNSRNYEYDQISHLGASLSHVGEGFMTRCVNESYLLSMAFNMEGSNLLCDTSMLLFRDI
jgi:hypothetical protein